MIHTHRIVPDMAAGDLDNVYPKLFVFDMIGTTIKASGIIPRAFQSAFEDIGIGITDAEVAAVRGKSKREAIAEILAAQPDGKRTERQADEVYDIFRTRIRQHYDSGGSPPIEGAAGVFEWCRSLNAKVVLTTGFDRDIAAMLVDSVGWEGAIDDLVCNDDVPEGRPAPFLIYQAMERAGVTDTGDVAVVGDTLSDLEAGTNAGVRWNFGVLSGAHDEATLAAVAGGIVIASIAALPGFDWRSC